MNYSHAKAEILNGAVMHRKSWNDNRHIFMFSKLYFSCNSNTCVDEIYENDEIKVALYYDPDKNITKDNMSFNDFVVIGDGKCCSPYIINDKDCNADDWESYTPDDINECDIFW